MAAKRKAKSAGKSKAQDQVLNQPALKKMQQKFVSPSLHEIEAMLDQRHGSPSVQTTGVGNILLLLRVLARKKLGLQTCTMLH